MGKIPAEKVGIQEINKNKFKELLRKSLKDNYLSSDETFS
jgi:hypothetical protein